MKRLIFILLFICSLSILAKDYSVTYTTSEDQSIVREVIMQITPIEGDSVNITIVRDDGLKLLSFDGILSEDYIRVVPNDKVIGGYLYRLVDKLRGNLFLSDLEIKELIIFIREK